MRALLCLVFLILSACKPSQYERPEVQDYAQLVGNIIECPTEHGPALVYVYAPHLAGLINPDKERPIEYFRTEMMHQNGGIFFEAFMFGRNDLKTELHTLDNPTNRRMAIHVTKDEGLKVVLAQGFEPGTRTPVNPQVFDCHVAAPLSTILNWFDPEVLKKQNHTPLPEKKSQGK